MINTEHPELKKLYEDLQAKFPWPSHEISNCRCWQMVTIKKIESIDKLGFSTRTTNTLKRYEINSAAELRQLKNIEKKYLKRIPGLGEKGIKEIMEFFEGENK